MKLEVFLQIALENKKLSMSTIGNWKGHSNTCSYILVSTFDHMCFNSMIMVYMLTIIFMHNLVVANML